MIGAAGSGRILVAAARLPFVVAAVVVTAACWPARRLARALEVALEVVRAATRSRALASAFARAPKRSRGKMLNLNRAI